MRVDAWTADEIDRVQAALRASGASPAPLPPSPRGVRPDGRGDYRGYPLLDLTRVAVVDVDLTGARPPKNPYGVAQRIQLRDVVAERVTFDRSGPFGRLHGQFRDCSFLRITTGSCSVSGTFTACDFTGATLAGAHLEGRFVRCRFHRADLRVASWTGRFEDCAFAGAEIHPIFGDVRAAAFARDRVTFTVTMTGVRSDPDV